MTDYADRADKGATMNNEGIVYALLEIAKQMGSIASSIRTLADKIGEK